MSSLTHHRLMLTSRGVNAIQLEICRCASSTKAKQNATPCHMVELRQFQSETHRVSYIGLRPRPQSHRPGRRQCTSTCCGAATGSQGVVRCCPIQTRISERVRVNDDIMIPTKCIGSDRPGRCAGIKNIPSSLFTLTFKSRQACCVASLYHVYRQLHGLAQ